MIVDDFDVRCTRVGPDEADTPLRIDADRMLTFPIAGQFLQTIARLGAKIVERNRIVARPKALFGAPCDIGRKTLWNPPRRNRFDRSALGSKDHRRPLVLDCKARRGRRKWTAVAGRKFGQGSEFRRRCDTRAEMVQGEKGCC